MMLYSYMLSFVLEPAKGGRYDFKTMNEPQYKEWEDLERALFKEWQVRPHDFTWIDVEIGTATFEKILSRVEELAASNIAIIREGYLRTFYKSVLDDDIEWIEFLPDWGLQQADKMPPGKHFVFEHGIFVSEAVKKLVGEHNLTGAEFIYRKDRSRYQAPQWFQLVPVAYLGRGVDHPWLDTAIPSDERNEVQQHFPEARNHFAGTHLRKSASFALGSRADDLFKFINETRSQLRRMQPYYHLRIDAHTQVLRRDLSNSDFAYRVGESGLYMSRRARDLFLQNGLLTQKDLRWQMARAVEILDNLPPGAKDYAADGQLPPPSVSITGEDRKKSQADWEEHLRTPKPRRRPNIKTVLKLLRLQKQKQREGFRSGASAKALANAEAELPLPLPAAWQQVLKISDGGYLIGGDFEWTAADELANLHRRQLETYESGNDEAPPGLLPVAYKSSGDVYSVDTTTLTPAGDCRVVLNDHEIMQITRTWESVADLLDEILTQDQDSL